MFKLRRKRCVLSFIFVILFIMHGPVSALQKNRSPGVPANTPWNLERLYAFPRFTFLDNTSPVRPLVYEGLQYKGKSYKVFAYYSSPGLIGGDRTIDRNLPAVVLVHPGFAFASSEWVTFWARRGYAAIAMDLDGGGPGGLDRGALPEVGPPGRQYLSDVWIYHAVAKIVLAHSLILSFPEVDKKRTAITGVSVGAHLTCTVAGLDHRFKAAVPVYGCAFLHKVEKWRDSDHFTRLTREQKNDYIERYDPSNYISHAQMPILFIGILNDEYYPLDCLLKTYKICPSVGKRLIVDPDMQHDWTMGVSKREVAEFIDSNINRGEPLRSFQSVKMAGNEIHATTSDRNCSRARLYYTTDSRPFEKKTWNYSDARSLNNMIVAPIPPRGCIAWFLTALDSKGRIISSVPQVVAKDGK